MAGKLDISKEEGECDPCFLELATSDDCVGFAMGNGASFCYYANGNERVDCKAGVLRESGARLFAKGSFCWR